MVFQASRIKYGYFWIPIVKCSIKFFNLSLEHTPDPQSMVYEGYVFWFGEWKGVPGVCSRGMLGLDTSRWCLDLVKKYWSNWIIAPRINTKKTLATVTYLLVIPSKWDSKQIWMWPSHFHQAGVSSSQLAMASCGDRLNPQLWFWGEPGKPRDGSTLTSLPTQPASTAFGWWVMVSV